MELLVNNRFDCLSFDELMMIDGGTFWGVVSGVAQVVVGVAATAGGIISCCTGSKGVGVTAIVIGVASIGNGISTIVSNLK